MDLLPNKNRKFSLGDKWSILVTMNQFSFTPVHNPVSTFKIDEISVTSKKSTRSAVQKLKSSSVHRALKDDEERECHDDLITVTGQNHYFFSILQYVLPHQDY